MISLLKGKGVTTNLDVYNQLVAKCTASGIIYDSFNRADNSIPGNTDTGQQWSVLGGSWTIEANQLKCVSAGRCIINSGLNNCRISIKPKTILSDQRILFRHVDTSNEMFLSLNTLGSVSVYKRVSGTLTLLGSTGSGSISSGDELAVICSDSSIYVYVNKVLKLSLTETANQAATSHGVSVGSTPGNGSLYDDFSVEGL